MEDPQTEKKGLVKRAWAHLTQTKVQGSQVSWRVWGLIVFTLMLTAFCQWVMPTQFAVAHPIGVWVTVACACLVVIMHWIKVRSRRPDRIQHLMTSLTWTATYSGGSARRTRQFLLANLLIFGAFPAAWVLGKAWAWFGPQIHPIPWPDEILGILADLFLSVLALGGIWFVLFLTWRGIEWVKDTIGLRKPYEDKLQEFENAIEDWRKAVEERDAAIKKLRAKGVDALDAIAMAMIQIEEGKNARSKDAQIVAAVAAKHTLRKMLVQLVPEESGRKGVIGRAYANLHPELAEAPAQTDAPAA
ncbi:hypothetical protein HY477_01485 [Candidatus Uhrbacteria bacterium]|nr:hypothetical protein [Candidatus Uhrbacteria bacterium]